MPDHSHLYDGEADGSGAEPSAAQRDWEATADTLRRLIRRTADHLLTLAVTQVTTADLLRLTEAAEAALDLRLAAGRYDRDRAEAERGFD